MICYFCDAEAEYIVETDLPLARERRLKYKKNRHLHKEAMPEDVRKTAERR